MKHTEKKVKQSTYRLHIKIGDNATADTYYQDATSPEQAMNAQLSVLHNSDDITSSSVDEWNPYIREGVWVPVTIKEKEIND
jgi:hypothetical protein